MTTPRQQAEQHIAQAEQDLRALVGELAALNAELSAFKATYEGRVEPYLARLRVAKAAIADLLRRGSPLPPKNAAGFTWTPPDLPTMEAPPTPPPSEAPDLKKLYRELARRYHPDHSTDEADRAERHERMAHINAAYAKGDHAALQSWLDGHNPLSEAAQFAERLAYLRHLHAQQEAVREQVRALKTCDLMRLKLEVAQAQAEGRDLLGEIVAALEAEYRTLLRRLYDLRHEVLR